MRRAFPVMFLGSAFMGPRDPWEWTLIAFGIVMTILALAVTGYDPHREVHG